MRRFKAFILNDYRPKAPDIAGLASFFAAIGLPTLSGFVSEAFVFLGAFQVNPFWTVLSTLGIVLGAGYMLWAFQRVFMGTLPEKWESVMTDVTPREIFTLAPLSVIILLLGLFPAPALNMMTTSLDHLARFVKASAPVGQAFLGRF